MRVTGDSPIKHLVIPDDPGTLAQRWDSALRTGGVQIDWPAWIVWGVANSNVANLHSNAGVRSDFDAESFRDAVRSAIPGRLPDVLIMVKVTERGVVQAVRLRSPDVPVPLEGETVFWLGRNTDAESRALLDRLYTQVRDAELRSEITAAYALHTESGAVTAAMSRMIRADSSPVVRSEALQWLSRYHCGDECITLLIEAVDDEDSTVRREALDILIEAGTPTSRAAVRRFATSHSDPRIRNEAAESL